MAEGLRRHVVLIVEDELLVAMTLAETLQILGCDILGPIPRLAKALETARSEPFTLALLDINLAGEAVYPVADVLTERGLPFAFMSGYARSSLPERFTGCATLNKPYRLRDLQNILNKMLEQQSS